ncbi:MAG TPA: putative sugar nucleotidyl transferase, partial [Saprospiraceae bacterium]|nr:putative sugar nucleotidyl transferase [Saprospiraceae bacterium]
MITLFDGPEHDALLPLTFTRPVCETLIGIGTIRQKWARLSNSEVQVMARDYLRELFPIASI